MSENNPYCHVGMICHDGCRCSGSDNICHCKMLDNQKCSCNGYCGANSKKLK